MTVSVYKLKDELSQPEQPPCFMTIFDLRRELSIIYYLSHLKLIRAIYEQK